MYTVYITPVKLYILLGAIIFVAIVVFWASRELRRDSKKAREIDMLESSWDLTDDLDEDELDEEFERNE